MYLLRYKVLILTWKYETSASPPLETSVTTDNDFKSLDKHRARQVPAICKNSYRHARYICYYWQAASAYNNGSKNSHNFKKKKCTTLVPDISMEWPKDIPTPSVCPPPMKGPTPNTGEPTYSIESELLSPFMSKEKELWRKWRLHNMGRLGTELRAASVAAFIYHIS